MGICSPQELAECELALLGFLNNKLDHAGHRNTLDNKFEQYKGDVMGATLRHMVKKGMLKEVSDRRYQLTAKALPYAQYQTMIK